MVMFIDKNGNLYQGDMQLGDREATEAEIETHEASIVTALKIAEAKAYLASTDYLYPRFLETGEPVPEDVVLKRKEARDFLRANPIGA